MEKKESVEEISMLDTPTVSVIIPLYNKGPYITRALNSVLSQTFQDFEVIVVDDGSTDDGAEIVRKFNDPRIQLIQQENQGVSAARNQGIRVSRADLIALLDADDEWLPEFLETVTRLRTQFPQAGAYATAVRTLYKGTDIYPEYRSIPSLNWEGLIGDYFRSLILGDPLLRSSSVAIPRNVLQEMNGFIVGAKWGEDQDLWGRIALKYPIGFSTSCCSIIHITGEHLNKIYSRVTVTRENPFIASANTVIKGMQSLLVDRRYLILYLDKITIQSAIYSSIVGERNDSKDILSKCTSKAFFLTKIFLKIWYMVPECVTNKDNIRERSLLSVSYLLQLQVRILAFIMESTRNSQEDSLKCSLDRIIMYKIIDVGKDHP